MSKDALLAKYEALPVAAQKQVEMFIEFLAQTSAAKPAHSAKRRFKFNWAGGLADMKKQFTAVELQHHINVTAMKYLVDTNVFLEILLRTYPNNLARQV